MTGRAKGGTVVHNKTHFELGGNCKADAVIAAAGGEQLNIMSSDRLYALAVKGVHLTAKETVSAQAWAEENAWVWPPVVRMKPGPRKGVPRARTKRRRRSRKKVA